MAAVLYVEVVPTTKNIKRNVEKEFSDGFRGVEQEASGVFGRIAGFARGAATAVTTAAASLAGLAVKGGLSRLLNIEDAQAKLTGLGHDAATVTEIMGNALDSVLGTIYSLDDAVTLAAGAVAAGIKPGQELERYLKLTADTAAIAKTSLGDVGYVFNQVMSAGRVYTQDMLQLTQRGIPIFQWLAQEYGVSATELRKMVEQGKVDSAVFLQAIEHNIGGAALSASNTTRGAFANMMNALNRVGANLLSGVFPLFREFFLGVTAFLGPLEQRAATAGAAIAVAAENIGEALAVVKVGLTGVGMEDDSFLPLAVVQRLMAFGEGVRGLLDMLPDLTMIVGPLVAAFAALGIGGLAGLVSRLPIVGGLFGGLAAPLTALSGPIGLVLAALAGLVAVSPDLQSALGLVATTVFGAISDVAAQLAPALSSLLPMFADLAGTLGGVLAQALVMLAPFLGDIVTMLGGVATQVLPMVLPLISQLATLLGGALGAAIPFVASVLEMLMPILSSLFDSLMPVVAAVLALISPVLDLIQPLLDLIFTALEPLLPLVALLIENALGPLTQVLFALIPPVLAVVSSIVESLLPVIVAVTDVLGGLIDFIVGVFTGDWDRAWKGIVGIFRGIWNGIVGIAQGGVNNFIALVNELIKAANTATGALGLPPIPRIPKVNFSMFQLAEGALVPSQRGGILANIGEGRHDEIVMPLAGPVLDRIREAFWEGRDDASASPSGEVAPTVLAEQSVEAIGEAVTRRTRTAERRGIDE